MRDSFIFYRSFCEAIDDLPDTEQLILYRAIKEFCLNDYEIQLTGIANTFWKLIKPNLTANNKRYEDGKKGGRPPKTTIKISETETSGFNNTETSGYFSEKPNKDDAADKDKDVNLNADADEKTAEINKLYILEVASRNGFVVTEGQAASFIIYISSDWLTGEFNFIDFVSERIKNSGKPHDEQVRLFVKSYKQDFYINEFPAWRAEKEHSATETVKRKTFDNSPGVCERCGGNLSRVNNGRLLCISCNSLFDFENGMWNFTGELVA